MTSDPSSDPYMDLDVHPQDDDQVDIRSVGRLVDLLRALAGRGGRARVQWWHAGHWHTIDVETSDEP